LYLAIGGSAIKAIETLLEYGVTEDRIISLNLICCPEGITLVTTKFPKRRIIIAEIDEGLDKKSFIKPGSGDFGCRYFGTDF
jgi:uracil phosphoribosyltransferase